MNVFPGATMDFAVNTSPVEPLLSFSLGSVRIVEKDWLPSSRAIVLVAHPELSLSQTVMEDRDVTLNDLQASLKDIKK